MTDIFRLGVSLVGKLHKLARSLSRKNPFAALRPAVDLWEPEDAEVLAALTRLRPLFPRLLDHPPAAGERPFESLHDLATATAAMERAGAALALPACWREPFWFSAFWDERPARSSPCRLRPFHPSRNSLIERSNRLK